MRTSITPGTGSAMFEELESRQLLSAWFVDPAGSDAAAGSLQAPLATVRAAIGRASAGDTISLKAGATHGRFNITKGGLTFNSYGQGMAVVKESAYADKAAVYIDAGVKNITINNLEISGGFYALMIEGAGPNIEEKRDILVTNSNLHSSGRDVIKITPGANHITIQYSLIHDSDVRGSGNAEGIDAVNSDNLTVRGNAIYNISTNGVYAKGGSRNTLIEYNVVYNTGHGGILLGQHTDPYWFDDNNPERYESISGIVRGNMVWDTGAAGIGLWGAYRPVIYGNTLQNVALKYQGAIFMTSVVQSGNAPNVDPDIRENRIIVGNPSRFAVMIQPGSLSGKIKADGNSYHVIGGKSRFITDGSNTMNFAEWQKTTKADASGWADVEVITR
jgi:hypothetical protein